MSSRSSSGSSCFLDDEELLQFETRFKELRMEKEMLKESQSESFELIRSLESYVRTLSESQSKNKKRTEDLERELRNCFQEIDYLQDQLNARDKEINNMTDYIQNLEFKLRDKEGLDQMVRSLTQELKNFDSERLALMEELDKKELELQNSTSCIEKMEESISTITLEYQCEIESLKLDLIAMEHTLIEAKKLQEVTTEEHDRMHALIKNYKLQIEDAPNVICLVDENKELRKKLEAFESNIRLFLQKMEDQFPEMREISEVEKDASIRSDILGALLARLVTLKRSDADSDGKMKKLSAQIHEYELLVSQLKEQLREEKLKAKEEAEDLAQEMAELRYQLTGLLEEEYKRRACIEQRSLQRITELEVQVEKERSKALAAVRGIPEA